MMLQTNVRKSNAVPATPIETPHDSMNDQQSGEILNVDLQWQCAEVQNCPSSERIRQWAVASCQQPTASELPGEVTIRIVDAAEMQSANAQWRGQNKSTNVLSFPADFPAEAGLNYYGDILVCAEVLRTESEQQGKAPDAHWAHIVVHGMLHLQGYDHIEDNEAIVMERCEVEILRTLGYSNPYLSNSGGSESGSTGMRDITEVEKN